MLSVADLKAHLRVTHSHDDAYIADLEEVAVAHVVRRTSDFYGPREEVTEIVAGSGSRTLWLAHAPVVGESTPVTVGEVALPGDEPSALDDFEVRGRTLVRTGGGYWTRGYEYAVTYTRGYAEGGEPENVRHAVRLLVAHWYSNRAPVVVGTVAAKIPDTVEALLGGPRTRV